VAGLLAITIVFIERNAYVVKQQLVIKIWMININTITISNNASKTYLIPGVSLGGLVRIKSRIWFI
jgi:hypothetical protein